MWIAKIKISIQKKSSAKIKIFSQLLWEKSKRWKSKFPRRKNQIFAQIFFWGVVSKFLIFAIHRRDWITFRTERVPNVPTVPHENWEIFFIFFKWWWRWIFHRFRGFGRVKVRVRVRGNSQLQLLWFSDSFKSIKSSLHGVRFSTTFDKILEIQSLTPYDLL